MIVVLMGVSGAGKSTIGERLAGLLGWRFVEADEFHGDASRAKMAAGIPLDDHDRWPWLEALGEEIGAIESRGQSAVLACSALRRRYRERLRRHVPALRVVMLTASPERIAARLAARRRHYMAPELLASQLETLEYPEPDEDALVFAVEDPPDVIAGRIAAALDGRPAGQ